MVDDQNGKEVINVVYVVILSLVLSVNLLVCILFVKNRVLFKKLYNVFLLFLVIIDLLNVIFFLVILMIMLNGWKYWKGEYDLQIKVFCCFIWLIWIVFIFSNVLVYICFVLMYKCWCVVVKLLVY